MPTTGRAANCSAVRAQSTPWCGSGGTRTTMMAGATSAIRAGALPTCCPISRRSKTTRPAPTIFAGAADRCMSPTIAAASTRWPGRFLKAAAEAGLPLNQDFNGASQEGAGIYQINTKGGRRMSAARAFLRPAMKRRKRPRRDERAGHENAVRRQPRGRRRICPGTARRSVARAGREVILSGGADQHAAAAAAFRRRRRPRCSASSASRSSRTTRTSAPICRITRASTIPGRPGCRRSTRCCGRGGASSPSACAIS